MSRKAQWQEDASFRLLGKRRCRRCQRVRDIEDFPPKGLQVAHWCRSCRNHYARNLRLSMVTDPAVAERIALARENRALYEQGQRRCKTCKRVLPLSHYPPQGYYKDRRAYAASCHECRGSSTDRSIRTLTNKQLKAQGLKVCSVCGATLPLTDYYKSSQPGQVQSACKACHNARSKAP